MRERQREGREEGKERETERGERKIGRIAEHHAPPRPNTEPGQRVPDPFVVLGPVELTVHVVDLEAGQVLGCPGFGGGEQRRVVHREVLVVVLQDNHGRSLDTGQRE